MLLYSYRVMHRDLLQGLTQPIASHSLDSPFVAVVSVVF